MKDNTIRIFFELIRAGLWENCEEFTGYSLQYAESFDWEEVYRLASEQSVLGLVLAGIDYLPDEQRPPKMELLQWIGEMQIQEQQNMEMNIFIGELVDKMRKKGIYSLLVKGQGVAQCYERPLWRSCGDVDFFLSDDNYERAKDYLTPLATHVDEEAIAAKHLGMTIGPWIVEIHGTMHCGLSTSVDRMLDIIKKEIFYLGDVRSWMNEKTQVFLPGVDSDIIIVFTHYLKHFYKGGLGIRQICDWSRLLWTYRSELDLRLLELRIRRMGLMSEWKAFGAFAVDFLGMPSEAMPLYDNSAKWHRKAKKICRFVIEVGNFGHNRDMSYYGKKSYFTQKVLSFWQRTEDLIRHASIFPLDSMRFFPKIVYNGVISAIRGE